MIPQIQVRDKWQTYTVTGETLEEAALKLLEQRVEDGFWYYGEDAERANEIAQAGDGASAWAFLDGRRDAEYEWVELAVSA